MSRLTLVRYTTKPGQADANAALALKVVEELHAALPPQVTYAILRKGAEFIHLFVNRDGEDSSPLTELSSFKAYTAGIKERCGIEPEIIRLEADLLGAYGLGMR